MTNSSGLAIAAILDELHNTTLSLDASNESAQIRYMPEDVMNALGVFVHVVTNYSVNRMIDEKVPTVKQAEKLIEGKGTQLAVWLKEMTGIDSRKFYDRRGTD